MDFRLTEDQISLQKAARDFLSKECTKEVVFAAFEGPDGDSAELYKHMAGLGWLALAVPESKGGLGLGVVEQAVLFEQLGYYCAPGPFFSNAALVIPALLAVGAGDDLLSPLLDGSKRAALVLDPNFVLDGQLADAFLVANGNQARWVDKSEAEVTPHQTIDGARRTARVTIGESAGIALGPTAALEPVLDSARALLSAEAVGGMQKVLDLTLDYTKVRTQFGRAVGSFQVVKHRLADMLLRVEASRSAAYYAAWANSVSAPDAPFHTSVTKAYVDDSYLWVSGEGIQLHGGIGFTWEHEAHLWFKRATMNAELLGNAAHHRSRALQLSA
jgi:alkylation response protein AidB-like acyl-CoA dehydrogenase